MSTSDWDATMKQVRTFETDIVAYDRSEHETAPHETLALLLQFLGVTGVLSLIFHVTDRVVGRPVDWVLMSLSAVLIAGGVVGRVLYRKVRPVDERNWQRFAGQVDALGVLLKSEFGITVPDIFASPPFAPLADPLQEAHRFTAQFTDGDREVRVTTRLRNSHPHHVPYFVVEITG